MVLTTYMQNRRGRQDVSRNVGMPSIKNISTVPRFISTHTQTDPVHVSMKSRRDMGFKIHPTDRYEEDIREYPDGMTWIRDYWLLN